MVYCLYAHSPNNNHFNQEGAEYSRLILTAFILEKKRWLTHVYYNRLIEPNKRYIMNKDID